METWILYQNAHTGNYELIPKSLKNVELDYKKVMYGIHNGEWHTIFKNNDIEYYTCETSPYTLVKLLNSMPNNKKLSISLDPNDQFVVDQYLEEYSLSRQWPYCTILSLQIRSSPIVDWCKLFTKLEKLEVYLDDHIFPHDNITTLVLSGRSKFKDYSIFPNLTEIYVKRLEWSREGYVKYKEQVSIPMVKSASKR